MIVKPIQLETTKKSEGTYIARIPKHLEKRWKNSSLSSLIDIHFTINQHGMIHATGSEANV